MMKFCSNCGKELKENADICLNCGIFINKNYKLNKEKIPGKGMSIAGMILGIISAFIIFCELLTLEDTYMYIESYQNFGGFISQAISYIIVYLTTSITGLCLSAVSRSKIKNGFNLSGLILNIISVFLTVIIFIYILTLY